MCAHSPLSVSSVNSRALGHRADTRQTDWLRRVVCGSVWDPLTHSYFVVTYYCRLPTISLQAPKQPVTNLSVLNKLELPIPKGCGFFTFQLQSVRHLVGICPGRVPSGVEN